MSGKKPPKSAATLPFYRGAIALQYIPHLPFLSADACRFSAQMLIIKTTKQKKHQPLL